MTYMVIAALVLSTALLVACTQVFISAEPSQPGEIVPSINVQTTDSVNVMGSQNVSSQDKEARGDAIDRGSTKQTADATPTVTVPINNPIGQREVTP